MNKCTVLILSALMILSCKSNTSKTVSTQPDTLLAKSAVKIPDTISAGLPKPKQAPYAIEGIYKAESFKETGEDSNVCDMTVEIKKSKEGYNYKLTLSDTTYAGSVTISKNEKDKSTFVTFKGIQWAEYEGDISNRDDNDDNRPSLELPVDVGGQLLGNEIIIQNSGNAMNYYTVFSECGEKYIRLVKR
jgi:hypothetical protein